MNKHVQRSVTCLTAIGMAVGLAALAAPAQADDEDYKVLVVGETLGFRHSHIDDTTLAMMKLGEENGFSVDVWDSKQADLTLTSTPFTSAEDLDQYATIIFASPVDATNDMDPERPRLLDDDELEAFKGYIHDGGGYVGLHAATDSMHTVPWYSELTGGGARFVSHPQQQTATMRIESPNHPSTSMLPADWERFDEWYNYSTNPREDVHVLITLDESTYEPGRGAMGEDHPLAWCHNFEGGRSWYEGAGHTDESWSDPMFLEHILGGIEWTAGLVSGGGDCVTFGEVDEILTGMDDGSKKYSKLSSHLRAYFDEAEASADAGNHSAAAQTLRKAQGKAHGLQNDVLVGKIGDLITWQKGLTS